MFLARISVLGFAYLATAILARELGPTAYGIYGVVISQLLWLEMLTTAGVASAIAKLVADGQHDRHDIESSARALLLGFSVVAFFLCWPVAPRVASLMNIPDGEVLFRIGLLDLPFMAIFTVYAGRLNGLRRFGVVAVAHFIYGLAKLAGVIVLIGLGFSLERVLVVFVLATCAVCTVLAVRFPPHGLRPRLHIMRELAVLSAPIGLYLIAGQVLLNLDLWSLKGLWGGAGELIGQYFASVTLAKTLLVIPGAQAGVLFASVAWAVASRNTTSARPHVQEATRFALIIAVAALVILGPEASDVLSLLFSSAYAEGRPFLPLQLIGFGLFALLDALSHALMAAGHRRFVAGTLVGTVPLAAFSNYVLIPRMGPMGAATSMVLGLAVATGAVGIMAYRVFGPLTPFATLRRVLLAAGVTGLVNAVIPMPGAFVLIKLGLLAGLYLLVLNVLGEITAKDFRVLRERPGRTAREAARWS